MTVKAIFVKGAREHNLKNIDVTIPRDKLVVITGVSGSGKSSLAFDTIYAEGQRRYVESLSAYARQFLGQMEKPDVDYIEGLSPAISIDQKGPSRNPRSIVGTVTEIYDYLRLLFARVGHPHCPQCGKEIAQQTVQQIVDAIMVLPQGSRIMTARASIWPSSKTCEKPATCACGSMGESTTSPMTSSSTRTRSTPSRLSSTARWWTRRRTALASPILSRRR
jgi:excinuclease UvrABC ATPase subunit